LSFEKDSIVADPLFEDANERNFLRATRVSRPETWFSEL
jgi:hypothetical protein